MQIFHVAFVGNPNVGKSAWINALSDANFKVGNWSGVTIEKKEAFVTWNGCQYHLIDLPGTYSLDDASNEEQITAAYLKEHTVDLIINVIDATNLSRNLLLTLYLRELQIPMLIIFNFMDEVKKNNIFINIEKMQRRLQIPILAYSALDKKNYSRVRIAIIEAVNKKKWYYPLWSEKDMEVYQQLFETIERGLPKAVTISQQELHKVTTGFFENSKLVEKQLQSWYIDLQVLALIRDKVSREVIEKHRYDVIHSLMQYVKEDECKRYARSRKIDQILLHRFWGLPSFFLIFSSLLLIVFQASAPWNAYINFFIHDILNKYVRALLSFAPDFLVELLCEGIIGGVGGVISFVPLMACLYFMLSLLEESGYMARIAFLLDRLMGNFNLSGKSFVAFLLGFGCNVPAIYATRTLDNPQQKKMSALLIPFMSCGARLPVYVLFASAFFPNKAGIMIISIYGIGILMALIFALLLSKNQAYKDRGVFIQELPPYRLPRLQIVLHKVKEEVNGYVKKAFKIVLWAMIVLWGGSYFPNGNVEESYIARVSKIVQPFFVPLGFGTRWETIAALPGGIIAKETIVGYFEQILGNNQDKEQSINIRSDVNKVIGVGIETMKSTFTNVCSPKFDLKVKDDSQVRSIQGLWNDRLQSLRAFAFMVYVLLSIPCIMSLQALYHEYGFKLMCISLISMIVIPYCIAFVIFQGFSMFL